MPAPRPETNVRLTDIVGDKVLPRLGNTGNELLADTLTLLHQHLGIPIEITCNEPPNTSLVVGPGMYILPDGSRVAFMGDGYMSSNLLLGAINFALGTITSGANASFSLPTMTAGNFVKALIQYAVDTNKINVIFGSQAITQAGAGLPDVKPGFSAICLVELHSTSGGVGSWDSITKVNLVKVIDVGGFSGGGGGGGGVSADPQDELFTVTGSPASVFNLATFSIPQNRKKLSTFINGVRQVDALHYNVTSDTQVTFTVSIPVNAEVLFRV